MTIEEMQERRDAMEAAITKAINDFETATDLLVSRVDLDRVRVDVSTAGALSRHTMLAKVRTDVEL